jgi:mono/diheme cytochrome c family protein
LFDAALDDQGLAKFSTLAAADDESRTVEDRARSYLDANCAQCHRPGGTVANFDARYETPLDKQQLIDGPILISEGIDRPRVISPHDIWRSIAYMRVNTNDDIRMPPLARETIDLQGVQLLGRWINSLPGPQVLPPPTISPAGGMFMAPVQVTLTSDEPETDIRYTLDGSVPGLADPRYERPIKLDASTVLRTRAFKNGRTRSITAQQIFVIGK